SYQVRRSAPCARSHLRPLPATVRKVPHENPVRATQRRGPARCPATGRAGRRTPTYGLRRRYGGAEPVQDAAPPARAADRVVRRLRSNEPLDVPMLELNDRVPRLALDEADLDFARPLGIGVELPLPVDLPHQHESVRRLPDENPTPV